MHPIGRLPTGVERTGEHRYISQRRTKTLPRDKEEGSDIPMEQAMAKKNRGKNHPRYGWSRRSREVRALTDHCVVCLAMDSLHVHHIRYRGRRGVAEHPEDLVVICEDCHRILHNRGMDGRDGFIEFRENRRRQLSTPKELQDAMEHLDSI